MGQACSNSAAVAASEPAAVVTTTAAPHRSCASPTKDSGSSRPGVLFKEGRRSTGEKKVSMLPVAEVLSSDGTTGQESVKDADEPQQIMAGAAPPGPAITVAGEHNKPPHVDSPIARTPGKAPPFAEDVLLPVREEQLQQPEGAVLCESEPEASAAHGHTAHSKAGSTHAGAMTEHSIQSNSSMSEKSFLTTAADAVNDEVSQSVLQGVPSAGISRFPTQSLLSVDGAKAHNEEEDEEEDEGEQEQAQQQQQEQEQDGSSNREQHRSSSGDEERPANEAAEQADAQ